jgi:hypothetical protein
MSEWFRRSGDGFRLSLREPERDLLRSLPDELRGLYDTADDDPVRGRLFPRAYLDPTQEEAEAEWRALVHPELLRERLAALDRVQATLEAAEPGRGGRFVASLAPEDVDAWLAVLNDARLALGTRLGVTESMEDTPDPSDPRAPGLAAYAWLTALEGDLVEALLDDLPG